MIVEEGTGITFMLISKSGCTKRSEMLRLCRVEKGAKYVSSRIQMWEEPGTLVGTLEIQLSLEPGTIRITTQASIGMIIGESAN